MGVLVSKPNIYYFLYLHPHTSGLDGNTRPAIVLYNIVTPVDGVEAVAARCMDAACQSAKIRMCDIIWSGWGRCRHRAASAAGSDVTKMLGVAKARCRRERGNSTVGQQ